MTATATPERAMEVAETTNLTERRVLAKAEFSESDLKNEILESNMKLKNKDNTDVNVKTSDVIKAINTAIPYSDALSSSSIVSTLNSLELNVNGVILKKGQFSIGSANTAYLQLGLGQDPDGYFGKGTLKEASTLATVDTRVEENKQDRGEISATIEALKGENFYDDFVAIYGTEVTKKYTNIYKVFAANGIIKNISINQVGIITIGYYSESTQKEEFITINSTLNILNPETRNIDKTKFMEAIKTKIENKEFMLKNEALIVSVNEGVKNIKIDQISANKPLIKKYLEYQKFYTDQNGTKYLDFKPSENNTVGMLADGDILKVAYKNNGVETMFTQLKLVNITTNNKFDPVKFVNEFVTKDLDNRSQRRQATMYKNDANKKIIDLTSLPIPALGTNKARFSATIKEAKNLVTTINTFNTSSTVDVDTQVFTKLKNYIEYTEANNHYATIYKSLNDSVNIQQTPAQMAVLKDNFKTVQNELNVGKGQKYFTATGNELAFQNYKTKFGLLARYYA